MPVIKQLSGIVFATSLHSWDSSAQVATVRTSPNGSPILDVVLPLGTVVIGDELTISVYKESI